MVVPSPTSRDLLKEHAIHDFGYSKDLDIYDFDYKMAADQAVRQLQVHSHFAVMLVFVTIVLMTVVLLLRRSAARKRNHKGLELELVDIEAQPQQMVVPALSHSPTPTPTGSPYMSKDNLVSFSLQTFQHHVKAA